LQNRTAFWLRQTIRLLRQAQRADGSAPGHHFHPPLFHQHISFRDSCAQFAESNCFLAAPDHSIAEASSAS